MWILIQMRLEHGLNSEAVLDLGSLPCQKLGVFFERCSNSRHSHSHEIRYFPSQLAPVPLGKWVKWDCCYLGHIKIVVSVFTGILERTAMWVGGGWWSGASFPLRVGCHSSVEFTGKREKTLFIVPWIFGMTSRGPGASVLPKLDPQVAQNASLHSWLPLPDSLALVYKSRM